MSDAEPMQEELVGTPSQQPPTKQRGRPQKGPRKCDRCRKNKLRGCSDCPDWLELQPAVPVATPTLLPAAEAVAPTLQFAAAAATPPQLPTAAATPRTTVTAGAATAMPAEVDSPLLGKRVSRPPSPLQPAPPVLRDKANGKRRRLASVLEVVDHR